MLCNEGISSRLTEAEHYIDLGRADKAQEILLKVLAEEPGNSLALYLLAVSQYHLEQNDEAMLTCLEGLKHGGLREDFHCLLGRIYFALGCLPEAEESFLESLKINPNNPGVIANYGYLMLRTGHEKKAARLMEEALRIDPEDPVVLHYAFYFYLAKDKRHEEMDALSDYIQYSSDEIGTLVKAGTANAVRGRRREARENFRQAYLLDPTNNDLLDVLKGYDEEFHLLYLPHRIFRKLGGPIAVWAEFIALIAALNYLKLYALAGYIGVAYFVLCIYTWITPAIYKALFKRKW